MRSGFTPRPAANPRDLQARVEQSAARFRHAMAQEDYPTALKSCEEVLRVMPHQMQVLSDYALCQMRLGQYPKAYKTYLKILQAPPAQQAQASETWRDGLAEVCGWLEKPEEVRRYGLAALQHADNRFRSGPRVAFPSGQPAPFDATRPQQNIIAFSLYGAQPRYCETLIRNVEVAPDLFHGWRCRVYLDDSVPAHVWQRLQLPHVELVDMSQEKHIFPTLWRFLVLDDASVQRFIVRDADSLLSEREAAAVNAWLASPFWFHHMRDYFTHTELLLAGMWGGCNGVFQQVEQSMRDFITQYAGSARYTDQYFLKQALWPTVRESLLSHDELFGFHQAQPWPPHDPIRWETDRFHVGSNAGYASMTGPVASEGDQQQVELSWQGKSWVYVARVKQNQWHLPLPFFLIDAWKAGELTVRTL